MTSFLKTSVFNHSRGITNAFMRALSSSSKVPKFDTLAVTVPKKHVFQVDLNRPQKLNTFNQKMWEEIKLCFDSLSNNPECRVVVLAGQGKHFTGGIEITSLTELFAEVEEIEDPARKARHYTKFISFAQESITSLELCFKPVISLTHNACVGAGVDLITAADIRYCTSDAWFQVKEVDVGLAADVGTLQRLPKAIGNASIARELCFSGRKFDAKEAMDIGLVSKVFADKDTALKHVLELAETIASKSPVAVQTSKLNMVYSQSRPNEDGLTHIRHLNSVMLQSDDLFKAAMAQLTKSDLPEFDNL